jgi:hypothetical protein
MEREKDKISGKTAKSIKMCRLKTAYCQCVTVSYIVGLGNGK